MTSQPGKQTIGIHILPNISPRKDNETMKFGQLITYNMRNFFLKNHTENVVGKLFLNSSKKSNLSIPLDQYSSKVLYRLFLLYAKLRTIEIATLKLSCRSLAFIL